MTILNNGTRNQYTATASQTVFNYTFEAFAVGDIVVYQNATLLSEGTHYTVTGVAAENGGTITLLTGATSGNIMTIYRETSPERLTDYQNSGDFLAEEVNPDFDRIWAVIQEQITKEDRSLRLASNTSTSLPVTLAEPIANNILRWNPDLRTVDNIALSTVSPGSVAATDFSIRRSDYPEVRAIDTSLVADNQTLFVTDAGISGAFTLRNVSGHGLTDNGGTIIVINADWYAERVYSVINARWFGLTGVGDETAILASTLSSLENGSVLDFDGLEITIFDGVTGVSSGDAVLISDIPRLFEKADITLMNGRISSANPAVSGSLLRYPTTLSIDSCSGITLKNMKIDSKGQSFGDTDASAALSDPLRALFAQQNGGHALLIVRSENVNSYNSEFRLCGSVASYYVMSSHNIHAWGCFSNCGSLGYAAYAFDGWAGGATENGFPALFSSLNECSSSKEGYTYASKGCVITEDPDVTCEVNGGYFADASPNGSSRDIGYAFGAASSQTIVNGATVYNCASVGYTSVSGASDTYLTISNVIAKNLTKTAHQCADVSFGKMYFKYANCDFNVTGTQVWAGDGDLSREESSFVAIASAGNQMFARFSNCDFKGATYGFVSDNLMFGSLKFSQCSLEINGFLCNTANIGAGAAGQGGQRGIIFDNCDIKDISAETGAFFILASTAVYTYVDLSTSSIILENPRAIESSSIASPSTFVEKYMFPQGEANIETITATKTLVADSAKIQAITPSGAARTILLVRPDKYKFYEFKIKNTGATHDLIVRDYTNATTYVTLLPGESAITWGDGLSDTVIKI